MYQRHKQKTSIGPKQKKKKKTRTSLVLLIPRLENKIAEEAKAYTMITTDENEAENTELHKGHGSFTLPPIMSQQSLEILWTATSDKV
jgi:hypothetical protein